MYNQKIIDRLNNLTYLKVLKNSNASAMTKKNPYGDIVKFYAQINKNDVIQAISFKCTGCSYFTALCSYFCEIAEGKTVDEALKIKEKNLVAFAKLDESRHHIYPLILDTFALLVKKYRKALEQGKVTPCEVMEVVKTEEKKTKTERKSSVTDGLKGILVDASKKSVRNQKTQSETSKSEETLKKTTIVSETTKVTKSVKSETAVSSVKAQSVKLEKEEKLLDKKTKKEAKKVEKESKKNVEKVAKEEPKSLSVKPSKKAKEETLSVITAKVETKATKTSGSKASKEEKATKKVATKKASALVSSSKVEETKLDTENKNIIIDEATGKRIKSVHLAVIKDHKDDEVEDAITIAPATTAEDEVVVSDAVPTQEVTNGTKVIVQTVEKKTRVQMVVKNGETTEVKGEKLSAMRLSAEGEDAHKHIHTASNLSDMLTRLNASKSKINSVEAHTALSVSKSVNGKTVDKASTLTSFSSMRDSLHRIREGNATAVSTPKALSAPEKETKKQKKVATPKATKVKPQEDVFVEREPKSKDIAKEVKEKEERGAKKGLFGWLFKK